MRIQESAENYLETILILQKRHGQVRSIDIASELSFSKPSVSIAMKNLRGIVSGSQGTCAEKPIPINGRGIPARRQCRAFLRPISPPAVQHPLCPRK